MAQFTPAAALLCADSKAADGVLQCVCRFRHLWLLMDLSTISQEQVTLYIHLVTVCRMVAKSNLTIRTKYLRISINNGTTGDKWDIFMFTLIRLLRSNISRQTTVLEVWGCSLWPVRCWQVILMFPILLKVDQDIELVEIILTNCFFSRSWSTLFCRLYLQEKTSFN